VRVRKLLSNNAAVVLDEQNRERVITGKGIGYHKKTGDEIDPNLIEKVFYLSSNDLNQKLQEVITFLPIEEIRMVEEIVSEVRTNLGKPVSDSLYIALADHLHFSLANFDRGIRVPNGLLLDIIHFYPDEYALGREALGIIADRTGRTLPDDEAGFVALHIVNAEMGNRGMSERAEDVTKVIDAILEIVREHFDIDIADTSIAHYRFINHLRYFSERILSNSTFVEDNRDQELLDVVRLKFPDAHRCASEIVAFANRRFDAHVGEDELLYLTIHIQHVIETQK